MRLFKREKPEASAQCPRCSQLVSDGGLVCPMCGWDLRDAYQGPAIAPDGQAQLPIDERDVASTPDQHVA
jgi:hypothetical protein